MDAWILVAPWLLGIIGTFIGSFVNVCIHRMPAHRSIVWPGSACPACGAPIAPWHNVPVVSWIALRGRCASCRAPISARYPLVEALTGTLYIVAWLRFGPTWDLAAALVLLPMLVVLFFTDLDERILPDLVTLTGTVSNWSQRASAEENAYEGGAKDVDNRLTVTHRHLGPSYPYWDWPHYPVYPPEGAGPTDASADRQ